MTTPTEQRAVDLVSAFVTTGDALHDRADLAKFLRDQRLITDEAVPITLADFDEAIALREGMRARLLRSAGQQGDEAALERGQRVLDGLRVTAQLVPGQGAVLAPAVVSEVRRGLARIAGAWAEAMVTGELWRLRPTD
ncbi:ABATE domain-containing protein [Halostreptopolyspora alba]|uniref:Stress-induced transcription regulator n=1 Tax=Halostreptopolyspora alba TaxID=2487137 RepID=A0A3N0E2C3_9ACTN|nr:hypothetical protein EFW17_21085 [Nocardiopsaceae bacterium YIM 96095]